MRLAIHQPQYMPWVGYFHKMAGADLFVLLDDVQFKKNEWQHRNRIRGPQGTQWLSIPNRYRFPQTIREVELRNETGWQAKHIRSLQMCYGKTNYSSLYGPAFEEFYQKQWQTMAGVTIDSVLLLAGLIGVKTPVKVSSDHGFTGTSTARLVNICRYFGADAYLAGAGGRDYMDEGQFEAAGIAVEYQEFTCPRYEQRWMNGPEDFVPNLSALDLLHNVGPGSLSLLTGER